MRIVFSLIIMFLTPKAFAEFLYQGTATVDFGQITVSQSAEEILSYKNASEVPASYNVSLSGPDAQYFSVSMNQCINVPSAQSCSITIKFTTNNRMQSRTYTTQAGDATLTAMLQGGVQVAEADVSTLPQALMITPSIFTFSVSKSQPFTRPSKEFIITNRSSVPQSVVVSLTGKDAQLYSIIRNTCNIQLPSGRTCSVMISMSTAPLNGAQNLAQLSVNTVTSNITYQQTP